MGHCTTFLFKSDGQRSLVRLEEWLVIPRPISSHGLAFSLSVVKECRTTVHHIAQIQDRPSLTGFVWSLFSSLLKGEKDTTLFSTRASLSAPMGRAPVGSKQTKTQVEPHGPVFDSVTDI